MKSNYQLNSSEQMEEHLFDGFIEFAACHAIKAAGWKLPEKNT